MNIHLRLTNYIGRYAPSRKKVVGYLQRKKIENVDAMLQELGYDESLMCELWIRSLIVNSKGEREIYQKLLKKDFPKDMVQEKITQANEDIYDWNNHVQQIVSKIQVLSDKGKSLRSIELLLISRYPYFRDQIREYMEYMDDIESLKKEIQKYKNKYNIHLASDKQKLYAALIRKGFSYRQIHAEISSELE